MRKTGQSGAQIFGELGDVKITAAVMDTLFRHGKSKGAKFVQEAANAVLSKSEELDLKSVGVGSKTLEALRKIAADPARHRVFLDKLKSVREKDPVVSEREKSERLEFFRFPGWRAP